MTEVKAVNYYPFLRIMVTVTHRIVLSKVKTLKKITLLERLENSIYIVNDFVRREGALDNTINE